MKCFITAVVFFAVAAILGAGEFIQPRSLSADELNGIHGGSQTYCSVILPTSTGCDTCLPDGNGKYVKCSTSYFNYDCTNFPYPGVEGDTVPTYVCNLLFGTSCGGTAQTFEFGSSGVCSMPYMPPHECFRTYTNGYNSVVYGVECPD